MLSKYIPIYLEHRQNLHLLKSLPPNTVDWSMLCPSTLIPESSTLDVPTKTSQGKLIANAATPPLWQDSWIRFIPLIGKTLVATMNAGRYDTTLEQIAEFIASDFDSNESRWIGTTVGVIDGSRWTLRMLKECLSAQQMLLYSVVALLHVPVGRIITSFRRYNFEG